MNVKSHLMNIQIIYIYIYIYILILFKLKYIPYKIHKYVNFEIFIKCIENLIFYF